MRQRGEAPSHLPIVGVMGSGSAAHVARAAPLGRRLAEADVHLLTGGGGGVMASVSESFCRTPGRAGSVIGILPWDQLEGKPRHGYPNPWVEIPIYTHLPLSGWGGGQPAIPEPYQCSLVRCDRGVAWRRGAQRVRPC